MAVKQTIGQLKRVSDSRLPEMPAPDSGDEQEGDGANAVGCGMTGEQLAGPVAAALGCQAAVAEATVRLQMLAAIEASIYFARRQVRLACTHWQGGVHRSGCCCHHCKYSVE